MHHDKFRSIGKTLHFHGGVESDLENLTTSSEIIPLLKNVIGGGDGIPIFTAIGTYNDSKEGWEYSLEDESVYGEIADRAAACEPMFLRLVNRYIDGSESPAGIYPFTFSHDNIQFGSASTFIGAGNSPYVDYQCYILYNDGTVEGRRVVLSES